MDFVEYGYALRTCVSVAGDGYIQIFFCVLFLGGFFATPVRMLAVPPRLTARLESPNILQQADITGVVLQGGGKEFAAAETHDNRARLTLSFDAQ